MTPVALVKLRFERIASYSASLLVVENWRRTARSIVSPSGDHSKTLAPPACWLDEAFVHIIHTVGLSSSFSFVMNSTMKLAKAYALIVVLGQY